MEVYLEDGSHFGTLKDVMETGANDVLMIKGEHGQILIPFISNYIESVDTDSKTIIADWGLDY